MWRYFYFLLILFLSNLSGKGQAIGDSIDKDYIEKTITWLASDKLGGRVNYTNEQLIAADFLKNEFISFGLLPFPGQSDFFIPFQTLINNDKAIGQLKWNGQKLADSQYYFFPQKLLSKRLNLTDFLLFEVNSPIANDLLIQQWKNNEKTLLWVKQPNGTSAVELLKEIKLPGGMPAADLLIVVHPDPPKEMSFAGIRSTMESKLYNIVGILPGRTKPEEAIIFSAHYDHVDHGVGGLTGQVFNGANDNASGTTAVLALAKYFALRKDNERTIIFCLFAGEEIGLLGSSAFVEQVNLASVMAVINIEMIGATNATGKNTFMLTGSGYSTLYDIMRKSLKGSKFKAKALSSDPARLFMRSDNYPFHLQGIVAHTVMCSDDNEPCYHKPCDDVKNLDLNNMTEVIKAIAQSCRTLIAGTDTPRKLQIPPGKTPVTKPAK